MKIFRHVTTAVIAYDLFKVKLIVEVMLNELKPVLSQIERTYTADSCVGCCDVITYRELQVGLGMSEIHRRVDLEGFYIDEVSGIGYVLQPNCERICCLCFGHDSVGCDGSEFRGTAPAGDSQSMKGGQCDATPKLPVVHTQNSGALKTAQLRSVSNLSATCVNLLQSDCVLILQGQRQNAMRCEACDPCCRSPTE